MSLGLSLSLVSNLHEIEAGCPPAPTWVFRQFHDDTVATVCGAGINHHIPFSWFPQVNAWLVITNCVRNALITSLRAVNVVLLGEGSHWGDPRQLGLYVTPASLPHAAVVCSFGEAEVIVGHSGGSTGIGAGSVRQVRGGGRVETPTWLYTLLKIWQGWIVVMGFSREVRKFYINSNDLISPELKNWNREVCLWKVLNELWSRIMENSFNLHFRMSK